MSNPLGQTEKEVERTCCRYAVSLGWTVRKQAGAGGRGKTDRLMLKNGHAVFVELKRPGGTATTKQLNELQQLRDIGFQAAWFDNIKDFKVWMNEVNKHLGGDND